MIEFQKLPPKKNREKPPRKRPYTLTKARLQACRNNSKASTGPHDCSATRFNAMKHGQCSLQPVLMDDEDPQFAQAKVGRYIIQQGAVSEPEQDACRIAVLNLIRFDRCLASDTSSEQRRKNAVVSGYDDEREIETSLLMETFADNPTRGLIEALRSTQSIEWLLGQVALLQRYLQSHFSLEPSQRALALMLFGRQCDHLFTDSFVAQWDRDVLSGLRGTTLTAAQAVEILKSDRPAGIGPEEFQRRVADELLTGLCSREEGQRCLRETLKAFRAMLERKLAVVRVRQAEDKALAAKEANVSVRDETMRRLKYQREHERGFQNAMRLLRQLQVHRFTYGALADAETGDHAGPPAETGTGGTSQAAPSAPAESLSGNKATAPEAVGSIKTCNKISGCDGDPGGNGPAPGHEQSPLPATECPGMVVPHPPPR